MASHGIRKDLNTHFHGIGLNDHHRCGTGWTAECLCVLLEHQTVLCAELRAVCRLGGVGAGGSVVQLLNHQLTSAVAGGSNDGDAQWCSLGLQS